VFNVDIVEEVLAPLAVAFKKKNIDILTCNVYVDTHDRANSLRAICDAGRSHGGGMATHLYVVPSQHSESSGSQECSHDCKLIVRVPVRACNEIFSMHRDIVSENHEKELHFACKCDLMPCELVKYLLFNNKHFSERRICLIHY
jgi:hypothetical protein